MRLKHFTKQDLWIDLTLTTVIVVTLNTVLFGNRYYSEPDTFLLGSLTMGIVWYSIIKTYTAIALAIRNRYPLYEQALNRIFFEMGLFLLLTALLLLGQLWVLDYIGFLGYTLKREHLQDVLIFGAILNATSVSLYEGKYIYELWQDRMHDNEQLKKQQLQQRFDSLKSQINPHFLFNSLNSLSSLISEDPARAERFLDEMSNVYRYLLRNNEQELVTVAQEIDFIRSYFYLLGSRYGESLKLKLRVDAPYTRALLIPLSLQIIIDNALKTNVLSKEQPLMFQIHTSGEGRLVITYNIQAKKRKIATDLAGLTSLFDKYDHLEKAGVSVQTTINECVVTLPLMGVSYENLNY